MFGPRVSPVAAGASGSRVSPHVKPFRPAERVGRRLAIDLSAAAATVLIAGSEVWVAARLAAAVAVEPCGTTGAAP